MTTATYCVDATCACHLTAGPPLRCCARCRRNGPRPLTIVEPSAHISMAEVAQRIQRTRAQHHAVLAAYHQIWYECGHTWAMTHFLGIALMKNPNDLWIYQDILTGLRPTTVIETGTFAGGSALWFAYLMDMLDIPDGRVITIDLDNHRDAARWHTPHPRITFVAGSSTDPAMAAHVLGLRVPGPTLFSFDADHAAAHVRAELDLYAPHAQIGDALVVEDTNIGWVGPADQGGDRGARGGLDDYLAAHPGEFVQDIIAERFLNTTNPGGWLYRVAPHIDAGAR